MKKTKKNKTILIFFNIVFFFTFVLPSLKFGTDFFLKNIRNLLIGSNKNNVMQGKGYGRRNITEVIIMEELDSSGKRNHVKKLWHEDSEKYYEWKDWCIQFDQLPDFFGTRDNPIPIDESKL